MASSLPGSQTQDDSFQRAGDRVGMWASFACALHCALLPLALALMPTLGLGAFSLVDIDQAFVVFATVLGVTTLTMGYRRHRGFAAWAFLLAGLALVWVNTFTVLHDHSLWHAVMMTIGGLLIAAAHLVNLRLTHRFLPRGA
ncbi:MerC domain-containing protein [Xanthomonadaceae bacterium JHOS43]|jgi:hypothetical protein|nr:MerC domain-containing protein [Xanthomonadaceae bacterium JHOS43]MCX7562576.1 MerC domain-containing protein [Xanthomonadaceae bacterium XH05]